MGCCAPLPTKHTWKYRGCEARHIFGSNDGGCASPQYTVEGSVRKKESRREKHDIFAAHDGACSQSIKTVVSLVVISPMMCCGCVCLGTHRACCCTFVRRFVFDDVVVARHCGLNCVCACVMTFRGRTDFFADASCLTIAAGYVRNQLAPPCA